MRKIPFILTLTITLLFVSLSGDALGQSSGSDKDFLFPFDEVAVVEGILAEVIPNSLTLNIEGEIRTFFLSDKTIFWRGSETYDVKSLQLGDSVMVRFNKNNLVVEYAWANLDRIRGWIERILKDGYLIRTDELLGEPEKFYIFLDEHTMLETGKESVSQDRKLFRKRLREGIYIDVRGLRFKDNTFRAISIYYAEPHQKGVEVERCSEEGNLGAQSEVFVVGYVTHFKCPIKRYDREKGRYVINKGRCGTCSTKRSDQAAWPAMDACGSCSWKCCDCSKNCKNQIYTYCGAKAVVADHHTGKWEEVEIVDCGPHQNDLCDNVCTFDPPVCSKLGYNAPIIDLTQTTFKRFYNTSQGCFCGETYPTEWE
jgi:hypothetical protein